VGRPKTPGVQRAIALVTVVGLHGLIITLLVALRNPPRVSSPVEFLSTVVLLSALPPSAGLSTQRRPATADDVAPLEPVESPIAVLPEISPPGDTRTRPDWASDARRAAAAVTCHVERPSLSRKPQGGIRTDRRPTGARPRSGAAGSDDGRCLGCLDQRSLLSRLLRSPYRTAAGSGSLYPYRDGMSGRCGVTERPVQGPAGVREVPPALARCRDNT
jgi:hypothetical protein